MLVSGQNFRLKLTGLCCVDATAGDNFSHERKFALRSQSNSPQLSSASVTKMMVMTQKSSMHVRSLKCATPMKPQLCTSLRPHVNVRCKASENSGSSASGESASSEGKPSYEILSAFFYGRAFAVTLSKRLGEVVVDGISEVSKTIAEQPQWIQDFQDEVVALANQGMTQEGQLTLPPSAAPPVVSKSSSSSSKPGSPAPQADLSAIVDELRSEIAYSRAYLQQIKGAKVLV